METLVHLNIAKIPHYKHREITLVLGPRNVRTRLHKRYHTGHRLIQQRMILNLSLTLEHGSIVSNLAAIRAKQPSAILFRYTIGVLPINCK